ncbi:MAG: hypothetical protein ACOC04_05360 [Halothece sp.]
MTAPTSDPTLLALMLALRNLDSPLDEATQDQLYEVGEQLELDPDDWEFIKEGLLSIVAENAELYDKFQRFLTQLESLDEQELAQLLPSDSELGEAIANNQIVEKRGYLPDVEPQFESSEILNKSRVVAIKTLKDDKPDEKSNRLSWLERVQTILFNKK